MADDDKPSARKVGNFRPADSAGGRWRDGGAHQLESIRASELLPTEGKSSLAAALLGAAPMNIDAEALGLAVRALVQMLQAEANKQHAYVFHFPDGRISLELEWLDVEAIARTVITTYVEHMSKAKPI